MKILISCCGGNTSNVLAAKLRKFLKEQRIDTQVKACAEFNIERHLEAGDVLLLAPQNYLSESRISILQNDYEVRVIHLPYDIFSELNAEKTYGLIQQENEETETSLALYKRVLNWILDMNKLPIFERLQRSFRSLYIPTMIGMIANLLMNLPLGEHYQSFIAIPMISQLFHFLIFLTIQSASLYLVFTWGYQSVEGSLKRRMFSALVCLATFIFNMPLDWLHHYMEYVGIQALFVALVVGMITTATRSLSDRLLDRFYPDSSQPIHDVLWVLLLPFIFMGISLFLRWINLSSLNELVSVLINAPIQQIAGSWNIYIFLIYITIIPWFFGIHGGIFINTVFIGVYTQAAFGNMDAYLSGASIPYPMYSLYVWVSIGGTGCTLALNLLMLRAKSKKLRRNGRQSILTSIFNINEPLIFGVPIAFNTILFLPFVIAPTINLIITYLSVFVFQIVAMPTGAIDTMGYLLPIGINAMISTQSTSGALLSLILLIIDILVWYPFFHKYDESMARLEEHPCHNQK